MNATFVPQFQGKPFCATHAINGNKVTKLTPARSRTPDRPDGPTPDRLLGAGPAVTGEDRCRVASWRVWCWEAVAISALGLVLTYSSSRVVNFAHGATAYAVAVFYHWLNQAQGWSIPASAVVSLLVFSPLLGIALWGLLFRRLTHAPAEVRFLATVGLWVALPAAVRIVFPFSQAEITQPQGLVRLPAEIFRLRIFDLSINGNQVAILAGGVVVVVGLTVLLRATPIGLVTRATVDLPRSAEVSGINTTLVTAGSWAVGDRARRGRGHPPRPAPRAE